MFSRIAYYFSSRVYFGAIRLAALWNPKARKWVQGRRHWDKQLADWRLAQKNAPVVWMHCSSLGEFEQGRPLLEAVKKTWPQVKTCITFFSPSGYEAVAGKNGVADGIFYLPADTKLNARRFCRILHPELVLWVKYEFWFHFLNTLRQQQIPTLLISAVFRNGQPFFAWYGHLWLKMLQCFSQIFVRDAASAQAIAEKNIHHVQVAGDTRFDRVIEIALGFEPIPGVGDFCGDLPVIVAGSTWEEDEEGLAHYARANTGLRFIIVPHEVNESRLREVEKLFRNTVRFSALQQNGSISDTVNVLIVDQVGLLSRLYNYGEIGYVGGGFGNDGVHNVLEAAVYGRPVFFGPVYEKYREAAELLECGGAFCINSALELETEMDKLLQKHELYTEACEASRKYVYGNSGAVKKIMDYVAENRRFTKA